MLNITVLSRYRILYIINTINCIVQIRYRISLYQLLNVNIKYLTLRKEIFS